MAFPSIPIPPVQTPFLDKATGGISFAWTQYFQAVTTTLQLLLPTTGQATTATAGTAGALPTQVAGYIQVITGGKQQKIPFFNE